MPERIPQATTIRVPLQAYLSSDHVSPATGKTLAVTISKNGGAYGNPSAGATNATEVASGSYYVDLSTTDTGTLGPLWVKASASGVDDAIAIYDVRVESVIQTGDSFALIGTTGSGLTSLAPAATALSTAQWTNSLATSMGTLTVAAIQSGLATSTALATLSTKIGTPVADIAADIATVLAKWTTAITEGYAADGAAPTPEQALMLIVQSINEFGIVGTTRTVRKLDKTTAAATFTLDDATSPTSTTRAT